MNAPVARLICLRHGESANVINQQAGALPDAPLTARGRDQAAAAADRPPPGRLHDQYAGVVYASSAIRSRQTAAIIASALGLEVAVLPGLSEVGQPDHRHQRALPQRPRPVGSAAPARCPVPLTRRGPRWHVQWPAKERRSREAGGS